MSDAPRAAYRRALGAQLNKKRGNIKDSGRCANNALRKKITLARGACVSCACPQRHYGFLRVDGGVCAGADGCCLGVAYERRAAPAAGAPRLRAAAIAAAVCSRTLRVIQRRITTFTGAPRINRTFASFRHIAAYATHLRLRASDSVGRQHRLVGRGQYIKHRGRGGVVWWRVISAVIEEGWRRGIGTDGGNAWTAEWAYNQLLRAARAATHALLPRSSLPLPRAADPPHLLRKLPALFLLLHLTLIRLRAVSSGSNITFRAAPSRRAPRCCARSRASTAARIISRYATPRRAFAIFCALPPARAALVCESGGGSGGEMAFWSNNGNQRHHVSSAAAAAAAKENHQRKMARRIMASAA